MLEGIGLAPAISTSFGVIVLWTVAGLVITRRLVWFRDLEKAEKRGDKWQELALQLLGATETLAEAAEVTTEVLTSLPTQPTQEPSREGD